MIQFGHPEILVLGDLILDKYVFGDVERISPEAPIPVVSVTKETFVPGGAANTASNIASLGGQAYLVGIVGNDEPARILIQESRARKINTQGIETDEAVQTIQKIRVIGQSQQLLRVDYENSFKVSAQISKKFEGSCFKNENLKAFVISDYARGTVNLALVDEAKAFCRKKNIPVIVDPRPEHKDWYRGVFLITPNRKEAEEISGRKLTSQDEVVRAGNEMSKALDCHVLITMGERGMSLFEKGREPVHIPTVASQVYDVSGAGDTVVATLAMALSSGKSLVEAAKLANQAAGIKVRKLGTASVSLAELNEALG